MPSCNAEDFVLYFFLCFRSLRDRAPASDAGSGGSSPFGSIFYCKSLRNINPAASFFESTLSLGSSLAVLSIKLRFARFLQVPRPPNGFLKECNGLLNSGILIIQIYKSEVSSNRTLTVPFSGYFFYRKLFSDWALTIQSFGIFHLKNLTKLTLCSIGKL